MGLGIANSNISLNTYIGSTSENGISYESNGSILQYRYTLLRGLSKIIVGDCIGFFLDMDAPQFTVFRNGTKEFCSSDKNNENKSASYLAATFEGLTRYLDSSLSKEHGLCPAVTLPYKRSATITANFNAFKEINGELIGFNGVLNTKKSRKV